MPITTNKYNKQLKKVLMDAVSMGMIDKNPYINFKLKTYQKNRNYLTLQEVSAIEKKEISIKRSFQNVIYASISAFQLTVQNPFH